MPQSNPLIDQGTLNRLRGSIVWSAFPELNVTASFLGEEGITLSLEGETTTFVNTMTGAVTSPEPYQPVALSIALLKTQPLSSLYKAQMEADARIGAGTVRSDSRLLTPYALFNCAIQSVAPLRFNGKDAGWVVSVKGYYTINNNLWGEG